ncbi:MAG: glycoside hydrolase family 3 N-terminal domain-containing protein [Gemmatimonadales bacterium]
MKHSSSPFAVFAVLLLGSACARSITTTPVSPAPAGAESPAAAAPAALPPDTAAFLPGPAVPPVTLTLREKAAQLVMPWIPGDYWASDAAAFTAALQQVDEGVGGFVVSIGPSPYDIAEKLNALQRASRVPLLIASDFESGPGARIREAPSFPGNMALGATDRELDAYEVGRVIAMEARAVGIQFDFAPVVDVNNNPQNPIINVRSFGENPQRVAELASAFIRGLHEHGMLSAAKHFPGHGDTGTDSHIALPVVTATRARLDSVELVPFRAAIREGTDAVMTAHLAVTGLTGEGSPPATLSPFVLDTLLRQDLGFRGLVVTDALNMGAIVSRYGASQAAVLALRAGADILLMPADPKGAIDAIVDAVGRGEVSEARLDSSVARMLAAKARAGLFQSRLVDINRIAAAVGDSADVALDQDISQRSLVLVKDSLGLVPLPAARRRHVLVVSYGNEAYRDVGGSFTLGVRSALDTLRTFRLWPASGPASLDSVRADAASASAVVFLAASQPTAWRPDAVVIPGPIAVLVDSLAADGAPVIAVSLGSPYVLAQISHVPAYVAAWSDTEYIERALARALLGMAPITGKLPVTLPPYPIGTGLSRAARVESGAPPAPGSRAPRR